MGQKYAYLVIQAYLCVVNISNQIETKEHEGCLFEQVDGLFNEDPATMIFSKSCLEVKNKTGTNATNTSIFKNSFI